jgi:hypothetical protein
MAIMPEFAIDTVMQMSAHYPSDRASFYFSKEGTTAWSSFFLSLMDLFSTLLLYLPSGLISS